MRSERPQAVLGVHSQPTDHVRHASHGIEAAALGHMLFCRGGPFNGPTKLGVYEVGHLPDDPAHRGLAWAVHIAHGVVE